MRVVLDTNVLLAAIATHGLCQALVTLIFHEHEVILSEHILGDVAKHYQGKFKASKRQADAVVAMLRANPSSRYDAHFHRNSDSRQPMTSDQR